MKANELMIGDWVNKMESNNYIPVIIEGIYEYIHGSNVDYNFRNVRGNISIEGVEPIPVTPEILEKNGFVLKPDGWYWCDCEGIEDQNYIFIQFRKGCDEVRQCEINYVNKTQATYYQIKYVHELQHALKLSGVKKGIKVMNF